MSEAILLQVLIPMTGLKSQYNKPYGFGLNTFSTFWSIEILNFSFPNLVSLLCTRTIIILYFWSNGNWTPNYSHSEHTANWATEGVKTLLDKSRSWVKSWCFTPQSRIFHFYQASQFLDGAGNQIAHRKPTTFSKWTYKHLSH